MMWFIIIVIGFIIFSFARDTSKQATAVVKQGGMKVKYRTLVNYFLGLDPRSAIVQETTTFINIGVKSLGGATNILIQQTYGNVTIGWKVDSPVFGKHNLEWTFNEFLDQEKMIEKVENDISKYNENAMQNFM